jgi:integrase
MGAVRKRPAGTWEARWYDPDGKQHSKNFMKKTDATRHVREMETAKDRGGYIDPRLGRTTFRVVAEAWYTTTSGLKPKTRAGYRSILDYHLLRSAFELKPVGRISAGTIDEFIASLDNAPSTKRNILRVLEMVMGHAVKKGMIYANPVSRADRPKLNGGGPDDELRVLTAEQVSTLAEEVGPRYKLLVLFAAYTGMRAGEICALRKRDLDLDNRRATVRESVTEVSGKSVPKDGGTLLFTKPKNGKTRKVALPRFLVEPLTEQVADKGEDDLVFPGAGDQPMRHSNFYGRNFKPAVRRALPEELHGLRFHDLRHTCASLLIRQGASLVAVSRQLGHSSIDITVNRYTHLFPDELDRLGDALDAIYEGRAQETEATVTAVR